MDLFSKTSRSVSVYHNEMRKCEPTAFHKLIPIIRNKQEFVA